MGKSTITVGILAALRARGLEVQPFKSGPDFLDPMHHNMVTPRISRNLDTWMFPGYVEESFLRSSEGADISVIEGAMGFYDGYDGRSEEGSSAHLSKVLRCPVVLVLNASASARSLGAVAMGFSAYDTEVDLRGIIFNKVGGKRHLEMAETSLRGAASLGGIPRDEDVGLKSRHLGLVPAGEEDNTLRYETARRLVEENLDLDLLIEMAREAPDLEAGSPVRFEEVQRRCRIGVAKDEAFNFYYQDNFDILRSHGADIQFFSPLKEGVPDVDGLYFGGGYPELFAKGLSENEACLKQVKELSSQGMPIYAECGGMMYLLSELRDLEGGSHRMTGIFDGVVEMTPRLEALGYVEARALSDNVLSKEGWVTRGHVFHYSRVVPGTWRRYAYDLSREGGIEGRRDGLVRDNTLASYVHLHFGSNQSFTERFVESCEHWSGS